MGAAFEGTDLIKVVNRLQESKPPVFQPRPQRQLTVSLVLYSLQYSRRRDGRLATDRRRVSTYYSLSSSSSSRIFYLDAFRLRLSLPPSPSRNDSSESTRSPSENLTDLIVLLG